MKQILKYLKEYKKECTCAPLFKLLEASFELIVPLVMAAIIDNGITASDKPYIWKMGGVLVLLAGLLYQYGKKLPFAYVGEVFGTGIIGGMLSYPIAYLIMGNKAAALFTFVVPFLISTCGGTIIAIIVTIPLKKTGILDRLTGE